MPEDHSYLNTECCFRNSEMWRMTSETFFIRNKCEKTTCQKIRESDCVQENEYTCCYCAVFILAVNVMMCGHNGGHNSGGKVINRSAVMEAEIGPFLSARRAHLKSSWIGNVYKKWMVVLYGQK